MTPTIWYCYDAYCGWCYGFSPVIKQLYNNYKHQLAFDVLSGGMILQDLPAPISRIAGFVAEGYKTVEEMTGVTFGDDYLWHIFNPDQSDWFPHSLPPARSLCVFKKYHPERAVEWAADIQYALHYEGRDLTDPEAYRHLLEKYEIPAQDFFAQLAGPTSQEDALYEFQLVKQLRVSGFPCVLLQVSDSRFYMIARGYTPYETLESNMKAVLAEIAGSTA